MKSLYQISQNVLKANITGLTDLGSTPVRFIEFLLPSIPTSHLKILEENSPQLRTETNQIWKLACIRDFISIRILVEDKKLVKEPKSWREVYLEEEIKSEEKMERLLGNMRQSYDKLADRAHSLHFDGVRAEKKRKLNVRRNSGGTSSSSKPTTLFSQVKSNAKKISSLYRAPTSQTKSYASAFPSGSSALRSNISTSFSNASITSRTTASSSTPVFREPEKKKEIVRATAFSKNGGGFIQPRESSKTSSSFPGKPHSLVSSGNGNTSSAVKVITRTVNVIVPNGSTSNGNKVYTSSSMNNSRIVGNSSSSANSNLGKRSR